MNELLKKKWFVYLAGFAFFFAVIRYWGFYEDAGRYLLQVIHYLHPERFIDDVPFMYGNQDSFTLFSPIISLFYKLFGVNKGAIIATLALQSLWCGAAIWLMASWTKTAQCPKYGLPAFIICVATLMNKMYGSGNYFPILDYILVARFLAFGLSLLGFATFFSKHKWLPLVFFSSGSLIHPLIGGWGIPLWLFSRFPKTRLPILIASILFPLTGFLHIGLLDFYSQDWSNVVKGFTPNNSDLLIFALILLFWILMHKLTRNEQFSKFSLNMFWVCFAGLFFQCAASYSGHMLLFQAQPYRVQLFCFVPMFPIFAILVHEQITSGIRLPTWLKVSDGIIKACFVAALLFLLAEASLGNYIQISLANNPGNARLAYALASLPAQLFVIHKIVLTLLAVLCLIKRRIWFATIFLFSFFNDYATTLPLIGIIIFLAPAMSSQLKNGLITFAGVYTFAELLMSLPNNPIQGSTIAAPILFIALFITIFAACLWKRQKKALVPIIIGLVALFSWDFANWDSRNLSQIESENQMDAFLDKPAFPQIKNRGRMLYVVDGEQPLESRFVFLNGTYADVTINVGEIFYKGQHFESTKRKSALLYGDTTPANLFGFGEGIVDVYNNPDTLTTKVDYLCKVGEISHLVTHYGTMPFIKADSLYLDFKKKFVYLYECNQ